MSPIPVGRDPAGIAVDPRTDKIYVTSITTRSVSVISGRTSRVTAAVRVAAGSSGVAVNPRTDRIYVTLGIKRVAVISGRTNRVVGSVRMGARPGRVAVNPATNTVFAILDHVKKVAVISGRARTVTTAVRINSGLGEVAVNPKTGRAYVTNASEEGRVAVLSARSRRVVATVPVGHIPLFVAVNPRTNVIYVTDRRVRSAHIDARRALPAEEVEQQFAGRSGDAGGGFPSPRPDGLSGPGPSQLESCAVQSPREEPARAGDVAPEGHVQCLLAGSGAAAVGSAHVLVVNEQLVEARDPAHPSDAEEAWRRSRPERSAEPGKIPLRERSSSSFGQAAPPAGQDQPGAGQVVALAEDQVRGEIAGRPRLKERRRLGTELVEQVAELCSLGGVEELGHIARV